MSLKNGSEREICQLWLVAKYYFDTAIEHYRQIDENQLSLTIKEIVDKFKDSNEIVGMKDLILASANFSSCSIRREHPQFLDEKLALKIVKNHG